MPLDPRCPCPIGRKYIEDDTSYDAITDALRAIREKRPGAEGMNAINARFGVRKATLMLHRDACLAGTIRRPSPPSPSPAPHRDEAPSPTRLVTASMEARAIDLRVSGLSVEEIATKLGVEPDEAASAIERVLVRTIGKADRKANLARELEVRRCDAIITAFWERATDPSMRTVDVPADNEAGCRPYDGQDKAAAVLLKAMERRSKLLGLDAPAGPAVAVSIVNAPGFGPMVNTILAALRSHPLALADVKAAIRTALGRDEAQPTFLARA